MRKELLETAPADIREEIERDVHLGGSSSKITPPSTEELKQTSKKKKRRKDEL